MILRFKKLSAELRCCEKVNVDSLTLSHPHKYTCHSTPHGLNFNGNPQLCTMVVHCIYTTTDFQSWLQVRVSRILGILSNCTELC